MFKALTKLFTTTVDTACDSLDVVSVNVKAVKQLSEAGLIKATNVRIKAELTAKLQQAISIKELEKELKANGMTSSGLIKAVSELADSREQQATKSIEDIISKAKSPSDSDK